MGIRVMSKLNHRFIRGTCKYCGRRLRYGNLPNRGPVMVHGKGDGEACRRLQAMGRDLVSRAERANAAPKS